MTGMPLKSIAEKAPTLRTKEPKKVIEVSAIIEVTERTNRRILKDLKKQSVEDRALCYRMTEKDIEEEAKYQIRWRQSSAKEE